MLCISEGAIVLQRPFRLIIPHALVGLTKDKLQLHHQVEFVKAVHGDNTQSGTLVDCDEHAGIPVH